MIGEDGGVGTAEKEDAEVETETGNDGDAQTSGRGGANLTLGNGGSSTGPMKTTTVAEEEVAGSTRTKRLEACNCSPAVRTQEAATRMGMVEEDH